MDRVEQEEQAAAAPLPAEADADAAAVHVDPNEFLSASHPMMERVQRALTIQLQKADQRITAELYEKEEEVARIKKKRENIGVELYTLQQQLAKLQIQLEKSHESFNVAHRKRSRAEEELKTASVLYQQKVKEREVILAKREEAQRELDSLNATVRQIELYNIELKGDIQVTRRAAYGTEEQIQSLEKEKRLQDFHIDHLTEQLRRKDEEVQMYATQLTAQAEATQGASELLRQASKEMELIHAEKREYMQKWKSSLTGMTRRDAALAQAEQAVQEQREKIRSLEMEAVAIRNSTKKTAELNEKLVSILNRIEAETKFLESQLATVAAQRAALNEQYLALRSALEASDRDLTVGKIEMRKVQSVVSQLDKQKETLTQKKQKIDEAVVELVGNQTTAEKGQQNLLNAVTKVQEQIKEKEIALGEVQNELARIQVDALNTDAHNKELKQTQDEFEKELSDKDKLIERYEQEIRQRHDAIEKKQIYILRLNRKYDVLTAHKEEANTGPLESTIKHLSKEIGVKEKESTDLQRQWIRAQTELVGLMNEVDTREDKVKELKSRQTVLKQKQLRMENVLAQQKKDIRELDAGVRSMHTGFAKLNDLIAKNVALQEQLANETYNMESEFVEKLKELEEVSNRSVQQIEALKKEKDRLFEQVIEAERQIMLWEKKIQLERETQNALDPEYGQPEIRAMRKEIHRMEIRLGQLQRQQEKLVSEMERAVHKQETIKLSYGSVKAPEKEHLTQATLKKRVADLKAAIKNNQAEAKRMEHDILRVEEEGKFVQQQLEQTQSQFGVIEDHKLDLARKTQQALFVKRVNLEKTLIAQKRAQRYEDVIAGKYKVPLSAPELLAKLSKQKAKSQKIKSALDLLADQNPEYADWFRQLATLAQS